MSAKELTYSQLFDKIVKLQKENMQLRNEVEALWIMLDEIKESDIQKYAGMLDDVVKDALADRLMMSKIKGEA